MRKPTPKFSLRAAELKRDSKDLFAKRKAHRVKKRVKRIPPRHPMR